jgi:nucleoside-diphosphate-sugar epimerase
LLSNVKKLCFISSIAALGDGFDTKSTLTEETDWNPEKPHSDYAISKYGAEMEVWRGQQEGLDVLIVNPGVIIGPGFWEQGIGVLFSRVKKGLLFYTLGTTGFIAVPDVVSITYHLMNSTIKNERFTLVAQNLPFREVLNTIADAMKKNRPKYHATPFLMKLFCSLDWIFSTFFGYQRSLTKATTKASYATIIYDNEKIKKVLKSDFISIKEYILKIAAEYP